MKILLAYQSGLAHRTDPYISLVPTGLCYLHACLRDAGHESTLANFSAWSAAKIKRELQRLKPEIVGISQWTHNRHISMHLAKTCRTILPDCTIVMGGGHATFCYEDILTEDTPVDIVVLGEAEASLLEIADKISSRTEWQQITGIAYRQDNVITVTPPRKNLDNLDRLPLPTRHMDRSVGLDIELQCEFIVTTRGCPSSCYFCSSPDFWGRKVRFRSPEAIVEEILYIKENIGLIYFSIRDDTFTADRKRVMEFCSLLQENEVNILWNCQSRVTAIDEELAIEMKRAGCECIQLGVESGSQNVLKQLGKKITPTEIKHACALIRAAGINLSIYLISDIPEETGDDIQLTVNLIRDIHPDDGYVSPLAYYPGTQLYNNAVAAGNTSPDIFSNSPHPAIFVSSLSGQASPRLLNELSRNQLNDPSRFNKQKTLLGYCYTTNVIAGEYYRQQGEYVEAEKEFLEITTQQQNNAWGWFLLGDLYTEWGKDKKAKICYARVLKIVPLHRPSKAALNIQ